jgi:type 1 fimbriae regulatory protein FimB/type 1 fimbriae regulatory protein FimE
MGYFNGMTSSHALPAFSEMQTGTENSAINSRKLYYSNPQPDENPCIVEVAFGSANSPKLESSHFIPTRKGKTNASLRSREFLTEAEVEKLVAAAEKQGRHGHRDGTMILIAYRHALRVSELCSLKWDQIDLAQGLFHVRRLKNGNPSTHPLQGPTIRALRRIRRDYGDSPYVFSGERKGPLTPSSVRKIVSRAAKAAGFPFPVHPHMLRHAAGYKLANDGRDTRSIQCYLGHRQITHTVRYTELSPDRFKDFWQD